MSSAHQHLQGLQKIIEDLESLLLQNRFCVKWYWLVVVAVCGFFVGKI